MKDHKVLIFISSILEKPTSACMSSCLNFYFVRMIIYIGCCKSHNPLMEGLGFSCHSGWLGCGTIFIPFFLNTSFPFLWQRFSFEPGKDGHLLLIVYISTTVMAGFGASL